MAKQASDRRAAADSEQDARISQLEQQQTAPPAATAAGGDAGQPGAQELPGLFRGDGQLPFAGRGEPPGVGGDVPV